MNLSKSPLLLSAFSGVLLGIASITLNEWLIWIALVPLIVAINGKGYKDTALYAILCGFVFGGILLFWMPQALKVYSGTSLILGYTGVILLSLLLSFWFAAMFLLYHTLNIKDANGVSYVILNMLLFAAIFFITEFLRIHLLTGLVWTKFFLAAPLSANIYMIQLASVVGAIGIGLLVAAVNYLVACSIMLKKKLFLVIAAAIFFANLGYGMAAFHLANTDLHDAKIIGIVCENVEAETRWVESGDAIINTMLGLVNESARHNPEILVWSETALPWTYIDNDDILVAISGIIKTNNRSTQNIVGYLTDTEDDSGYVYNSAYLIDADGSAIGRVDKRRLLTFFEEPLLRSYESTAIPMLTQSIYNNIKRGERSPILNTSLGKAWVMVCNESLLPFYVDSPKNTPDYLVNMSNDAWLENTQNIAHHFYLARLRAIEYRKDMIINSNRGMSGIISSRGEVVRLSQSDSPELIIGPIHPNTIRTLYARFPLAMPIFIFLIFCIIILISFTMSFKSQPTQ